MALGAALVAPAAGALELLTNPPRNIAPLPNFLSAGACHVESSSHRVSCDNPCVTTTARSVAWPRLSNTPACTGYVLRAINDAKSTLGEPPIVLPTNWYQLTAQRQLFVIINLERRSLGYPPYLGLNPALSAEAQRAARAYGDPAVTRGFPMGNDPSGYPGFAGAWSAGLNALEADYGWLYADGWATTSSATWNQDCTSTSAPGCWVHRDGLLGSGERMVGGVGVGCTTCEMGAGWAMVKGQASWVLVIERPRAKPPAMQFTWASELPYLRASSSLTGTLGQ